MRVKYIPRKNGQGVWCYAEKGRNPLVFSKLHRHHTQDHHHHHNQGVKAHRDSSKSRSSYPTLVFLHGFGSDKDSWPSMIRFIPSTYHCIILDLPGHGESTFVEGVDEPRIESYVTSIREFLELTGLDESKIFLVGYDKKFHFKFETCAFN